MGTKEEGVVEFSINFGLERDFLVAIKSLFIYLMF